MASVRRSIRSQHISLVVACLAILIALAFTAHPAGATTGSISGTLFDDVNNNGIMDSGETAHGSLTVYIDTNNNGVYDTGEPTTVADASGAFSFNNVADNTYKLRVVPPTGYGATNTPLTVTVANGANVMGANLGVSNLGAISGTVFNDVNGNGTMDTADAGISGRTVYIDTNNSGTLNTGEPSTTTDVNGKFSFTGLSTSSTYVVRVVLPAATQLTTPLPSTQTLSAGITNGNINFGLFTQNTISGTVYNDVNANGAKDIGESGVPTKSVFLDTNGNGVKDPGELSAVTNASGSYTITGVGPGTYTPTLVLSSGTLLTSTAPGAITTTSGSTWAVGNDFGQFTQGTISGTIYNDLNASGAKDTNETGLAGKTVFLDANGNGTLDPGEVNQQTNATGGYSFTGLGPGTYQVAVVAPSNTVQTSVAPSSISMTSGLLSTNINIGLYIDASITGQVYNDTNGNGSLTAGESGISGVTVYIDTNGNNALDTGEATTTTDSTGHFTFSNLQPGTYKIRLVSPVNYTQTSPLPTPITPTSGSTSTTNIGLFQFATLGGQIYNDVTGNGAKDTGDAGLSGVTIFLDTNNNGTFDLGEPSTTSDSNGNWSITGLTPGSYKPKVILPTLTTLTTTPPTALTVTSGMVSNASNFGLFTAASISGSVYGDFDGDGTRETGEAGLAGKTVFLDTNNDGALSTGEPTATTDSAGNYTFTNLGPGIYRPRLNLPGGSVLTTTNVPSVATTSGTAITGIDFGTFTQASISGTIFNDVNGDGVKQGGDAGLATRTVFLDLNGNGIKDGTEPSITTSTGGTYSFTGLGPGTYQVKLLVPTGSIQTSVDPPAITTSSGSSSGGNDFGLYQYGSIAGTVYNDINGNGQKGSTELGIAGRTVYIDANNNGVLDPGELSTTTSSTGTYSFTGLLAGTYNVQLLSLTGTMQTSTTPTPITIGSNSNVTGTDFGVFVLASISGEIYADANGNGTKNAPDDVGLAGITVFLDSNGNGQVDTGEPTTVTDASGNYGFGNLPPATYRPRVVIPANMTVTTSSLPLVTTSSATTSTGNDIGVFVNGTVSGTVFTDTNGDSVQNTGEQGAAGDRVYCDNNGNNAYTAGEPTAITDANGNYSITDLKVGSCKPRVVPATGTVVDTATPATISIVSGTNSTGINFGMFTPGSITGTVFNDVNGNGMRDTGDSLLSGKTVYIDANGNGVKDANEPSATTNTQGVYTFSNLNAGTYAVRVVLPTGQVQTTTNPANIAMTSGLNTANIDFGLRAPPTTTTPTSPTTPVVTPTPVPADAVSANTGYWMVAADGETFAYGGAPDLGQASNYRPTTAIVGLAPTATNKGYYEVGADGGIFAFGDAQFYGSMGGRALNKPMVGIATTPTGLGYWTVASDGGIFSYGDAKFYGSTGSIKLNQPIVSMESTSDGKGYWLVASDGGIFAYGDAKFYGSTGSIRLNKPIVGMTHSTGDAGYWLVASDGGIFAFGNAPFYGSMGSKTLNKPIVSIHAPYTGDGYWMFASDGGVFAYGSSQYFGGSPPTSSPVVE